MVGEVEIRRDVEYARVGDRSLRLDVVRPAGGSEVPVVLHLHGGGWMLGDKAAAMEDRLVPFARMGLAVASAAYRFTDVATHPAQVHDARGAVRWLRAHGAEHGLRTERIGAWGASAGDHLALLLGLTSGLAELEGTLGGGGDGSVQAVCAWFAPVDLEDLHHHPPDPSLALPPFMSGPMPVPSMEARLLGLAHVLDDLDVARAASPITYAGRAGDTPFLLMHGDADALIPLRQSTRMHAALVAAGADARMLTLAGANHEGSEFHRPEALGAVAAFFAAAL